MIKNIIFDLGGVLLCHDFSRVAGSISPIFDFLGLEHFPKYWADFDLGNVSQRHVSECIAADRGISVAEASAEIDSIRDVLSEAPKSLDLVRELHSMGYRLYVLSNMPHEFWARIRHYELFSYMQGWVISCEEHLSKPDERIYRLLMERYGLEAAESVFVDDRRINIEAARAVGMEGIVFTDVEECRRQLLAL